MNKKKTDRALGMDRDISRRDFLNGVGVAVGASLFPNASAGAMNGTVMTRTWAETAGAINPGRRSAHTVR